MVVHVKKKLFAAVLSVSCSLVGSKALSVEANRGPVVIELFTSQGCSSCPPADKLLATLSKNYPEAIVLSEHVDYWNWLGWKDPFSAALFSERQRRYARALKQSEVYTPEMIVDGVTGFVGRDERAATAAISKRAQISKLRIKLIAMPDAQKKFLNVRLENKDLKLSKDEYLIVFLTQDNLSVKVGAGENSGRLLNHTGVARAAKPFDTVPVQNFSLPIPTNANLASIKVIALRQNRNTMEITGAGITGIADLKAER